MPPQFNPLTDVRSDDGVICLGDFYAAPALGQFVYMPTREIWSAENINDILPPIAAGYKRNGKQVMFNPAVWLRKYRRVEFPDHGRGTTELLSVVAVALSQAKMSGGDQVRWAETAVDQEAHAERASFDVLQGLVIAVDTKDRYTKRHSEDVARYALFLAEQLGLPAGVAPHAAPRRPAPRHRQDRHPRRDPAQARLR